MEQSVPRLDELLDPKIVDEDREQLLHSLEALPFQLRAVLLEQGLKVSVVGPGESLIDKGVIREVRTEELQQHNDSETVGQVVPQSSLHVFDRQVQALTSGRWRAFRPVGRARSTYSAREIAAHHGIEDPWFLKEFEQANAERLRAVRQAVLEREQVRAASGEFWAESAGQRLEQYRSDPLSIPIDWRAHPVAVPDWHHFQEGGLSLRLNGHDRQTLEQWEVQDGKVVPHRTLEGQYFGQGDQHTVVLSPLGVRQSDTVLHEIGHAVMRAFERRSPEAYASFEQRLRSAHDGVIPHGFGAELDPDRGASVDGSGRYQISDYSRVNPSEYFAEGFLQWIKDPKALQRLDPVLADLVVETLPNQG